MAEPKPIKILIVDDQSSTRAMLREALAGRAGTAIHEAADGESALAKVEELQPDLVLCDIQMQPVDGITLLKAIRGHDLSTIRNTPVIIMSAVATREAVVSANKSGATAIIAKPISLRMLNARVDAVLGRP
jgi:two-component system, chemotaxis family, chemotaxis protein CheY